MNRKTPSKTASYTTERVDNHDFGVTDKKGRAIGAQLVFQTRELVASTDGFGLAIEPGNYFCFTPHATRGGETFGAFSGTRYFKSEAARATAVAKYLADASKRALKTAA